ncbi:MAG: ATP-binding protein [Burkholderiales bacterium]
MPPPQTVFNSNLRRLFVIRNLSLASQCVALAYAGRVLEMAVPLAPIVLIMSLLGLWNFVTWRRLVQPREATNAELFSQLVVDVAALTALLYFSGGATNPFISLYLLPLTLAAAALPSRYTWGMAMLTAACYTLLMSHYRPLPFHHGDANAFELHLLGMWVTFAMSAALIAFFVNRIAATVRERDRTLAAMREETLRNERIVALGTFAAGAAHQLGTPLSTMAVIAKELEHEHRDLPKLVEDVRCMRDQIDRCKRILTGLLTCAGQPQAQNRQRVSVDAYLEDVVEAWQLVRPVVTVKRDWEGRKPAPKIIPEPTLAQAIMNLLNNAADASSDSIEVVGRWNARELAIDIRDQGSGLTNDSAAKAGQLFFSTKENGLGIGIFLANATVERLGGTVRLFNRPGGGACTRVTLPLAQLRSSAQPLLLCRMR